MLVQGSPTQATEARFHYSDKMADSHLDFARFRNARPAPVDPAPKIEEFPARTTSPARKIGWSFSSLLLWACPEFLESFSQ